MTMPDPRQDDLAADVRAALGARMDHMDVSDGDLEGVVTRARRGQVATRAAGVVAAVVVLAGGCALAMQLARGQVDPPDVVAPTSTPAAVPTPAPTGTPGSTTSAPPAPSVTPSAGVTEPGSTSTPSPADRASPRPTATTDPVLARVRRLLTTPGTLVTATGDGIDLVTVDDTVVDVPGLAGPVDLAFPDGNGGIVFQRNEQGIGLLRDGEVTTLVALAEFGPREVDSVMVRDDGDGADDTATLAPTRLVLDDVDAVGGRMSFKVTWDTEQPSPEQRHGLFRSDLDGSNRTEVDFAPAWESSAEESLAGDTALVRTTSEASGQVFLRRDGQRVDLAWAGAEFGEGTTIDFPTVQLADDRARFAAGFGDLERGGLRLEVVEVATGTVTWSTPVPGREVTDITTDQVVVFDGTSSWVLRIGGGGGRSAIPGRATMVH